MLNNTNNGKNLNKENAQQQQQQRGKNNELIMRLEVKVSFCLIN